MNGVEYAPLRRRPARSTVADDFARVTAFLMSRGLSGADAVKAIELSGEGLFLPDQKISVVGIVEYRGDEVGGAVEVRCAEPLDPAATYRLLRSREALERAAAARGGPLKLMDEHPDIDVDVADDEELRALAIGEVGDVTFIGPFLRADIVVTRPSAIQAIKTRKRRAWSIGYAIFDLDMTPGVHQGEPYDGAIRQLQISHVGLVERSRAGLATRISHPNAGETQ